jgi:predicted acyl esterase
MKFTIRYVPLIFLSLFVAEGLPGQGHFRPVHMDSYDFKLLPPWRNAPEALIDVTRYDFTVTMRDGIIIDALKYIPNDPVPAGGWPTVIMVHGYGDSKETLAEFCRAQAEYGYYTATYSVRGQGNSGGLSNLISIVEAQDLVEFVNYIKADSVSGSAPNNILIMGGSQGGLLPLMAASRFGLNVKTLISALAPPNFASSWIENGCIKMTFLWTVEYTPDTARYTPLVDRMSDWVYENNKEKWDSLAYWLPIDRDFMPYIPNNQVPLIIEGSWQDKFFNGTGIIQSAQMMTVPFRMYMGAVKGHGGDTSSTENEWHMQFFNDWFFYWLFGIDNGVLNKSRYEFAYTTYPILGTVWTFVHDSSKVWPPTGTTNWRLYFNRNNRLRTTVNPRAEQVSLRNQVSGGLTMKEAVDEEFTGSAFNSKFTKRSIYWQTDLLSSDVKMVGAPKISMNYYSTSAPFCQFNFQIYEVRPNGSMSFVDRANFTDRNYTANSRRITGFNGQAHSHVFKAGNRIRLVLTNLDTAPSDTAFMKTNPFVLPVLINGYNYVMLNQYSYIQLPIIGVPTAERDNLENGEHLSSPYRFSLEQNYPNPFNPSTVISYSLGSAEQVELKIYDILGREVRSLLNEFKPAGNYSVEFNASGLASGVYFYTIAAGTFRDVKKLLLVK